MPKAFSEPTRQHRDEAHALLEAWGQPCLHHEHNNDCDDIVDALDHSAATARAEGRAEGLREAREQQREAMLGWRGVDDPCEKCGGAGRRLYGSTATWHGGAAGQMVTADVCDRCWGTGDKNRKGVNLRALGTVPQVGTGSEYERGLEAAAKLCDARSRRWQDDAPRAAAGMVAHEREMEAYQCARAIRAELSTTVADSVETDAPQEKP